MYFLKVHLPHGAVVTIANGKGKRPQFINIWLKASPADYQQTEGKGLDYFYRIALMNLYLSITEILYEFKKTWSFTFSLLILYSMLFLFLKVTLPHAEFKVSRLLIAARGR